MRSWFSFYFYRSWLDDTVEGIFNRVFRRQVQRIMSRLELQEAQLKANRSTLANIECAVGQMKLGAKVSPKGGSWVVIAYTLGDKDYVNFYDFKNSNVGALRDFLEKFARAGMATRSASPFDRDGKPPAGGKR